MIYEDEKIIEFVLFGGVLMEEYPEKVDFPICRGSVFSWRKIKIIEEFWEDLALLIDFQLGNNTTVSAEPMDWERHTWETDFSIPGSNDLENNAALITKHIANQYHKVLFPILERQSDIYELYRKYNNPIKKRGGGGKEWFLKLISAKLAGAENYDQIRDFVYAHFSKAIANPEYPEDQRNKYRNWLEALETVHQRLQSVEPLKDPYLGSPKRRQMEEEWRALNR